jgi:folate-binding protein YgfZ
MTDVLSTPDLAPGAPAAVLDYGDPAAREKAQYAALRTGALLVDHSSRDVWVFRGPQARVTVAGLVTNDVVALAAGHGCYAAALTPKGRIVADVRVFAVDTPPAVGPAGDAPGWLDGATLVVDVPPRAAEGWGAVVRKFVNPRVTPYRRAGNTVRGFGLYGAHARDALAAAFGAPPSALAALPPYAHATFVLGGDTLLAVRVPDAGGPDAGLDGYLVLVPAVAYDAAWARVAAVPGVAAGEEPAYTTARIEAGYPEWGVDIDDTTIPQEANLDELGAISYTKGCYTGQEVVARVHFRGHVNRHLRGLAYPPARWAAGPDAGSAAAPTTAPTTAATSAPATAATVGLALVLDGAAARQPPAGVSNEVALDAADAVVPPGASLVDEADKVVGDVRSSARSPRLGGVALGMVRREVPPGAVLRARWTDADGLARERGVTVTALPFPR